MKEQSKHNAAFNLILFAIIYFAEMYLVYRFILTESVFIILAVILFPFIVYFSNKHFGVFGKNRFL